MGARPDAPLSARQQEILKLLSLGRSNKEIAQHLRLSTGTVKQHIYALFRKLGVTNRTTAVIRGAGRIVAPGAAAAAPVPTEALAAPAVPEALRYTRRLVTAVVVEPRPEPVRSTRQAARLERQLGVLREGVARLAFAYDASSEPVAGGGVAAWFGQRVAHGDDAARAIAFTLALRRELADVEDLPCALGIGTVPEVVGEAQRASLAFRAFRLATLLASFGEPLAPLACANTVALAGLAESPGAAQPHAAAGLPVSAWTLNQAPLPAPTAQAHWGGLPFLGEVARALARAESQWLAVESWPPEHGTRLLRAIGEGLAVRGLPLYALWMPSPGSTGSLNDRLISQLRHEFRAHGRHLAATRLDEALLELAAAGPAAVLAYGIDALPTLKDALQRHTLERIGSAGVALVAGAMRRAGAPQTAVRLLGAHPDAAPFSRVLRMAVPTGESAPAQLRPDVQALLDRVSALARLIARAAADLPAQPIDALAAALGASPEQAVAGCRELEQAGLAVLRGGQVHFRDAETAAAVRASLVAASR